MPATTQPDGDAGEPADETRAVCRPPGLDVATAHRPAVPGGTGERMVVTLQAAPTAHPALTFDPVAEWVRLAQSAWTPWLALANTVWALPRIVDRGGR